MDYLVITYKNADEFNTSVWDAINAGWKIVTMFSHDDILHVLYRKDDYSTSSQKDAQS